MISKVYAGNSIAILLLLVTQANAQFGSSLENSRLISLNNKFETGLTGWNNRQISSSILTRDWIPDGSFPHESFADLGSKLVRIRGVGVWGQTLAVNASSKLHILNAHAFKKAIKSSSPVGYASLAVTYYDAQWNELDSISVPISEKDPLKNRGIGDGLNFSSWGIQTPTGTVNAFLFVYCSANTEVYVDSFGLFEYSTTTKPGMARNLIQHPTFTTLFGQSDPFAQGFGIEFWESDRDWSIEFVGILGSHSQPEYAYQFVPIQPGRTYTFSALASGTFTTPSGAGIDYYDADWQHIGSDSIDLTNRYGVRKRIETPSATSHASIWVWCDTVRPGEYGLTVSNGFYLQQQEAQVTRNTSMIAYDTGLRGGKGGTLGATVTIIYSDSDGLDISSIDDQDAYFVSRTNAATTYPAQVLFSKLGEGDKVLEVEYLAKVPWYTEVGSLVIRPRQVKDKLGNYAPGKTFGQLQLP